MDGWAITGAILSGIGALVSCWQALRAKGYRDEIVNDRLRMALIDMAGTARQAREECKKIVTPVDKPMRGVDSSRVITLVQDCSDKLKEYSHRFEVREVEGLVTKLNSNISAYKTTTDKIERQRIADDIYGSLSELIALISRKLDRAL